MGNETPNRRKEVFTFTLKGKEYQSDMNGNQVEEYLRENFKGNNFAESLVSSRERYGRWTQKQAEWCHKLVIDHKEQSKPTAVVQEIGISLPTLTEFLSRPVKLKRVKLTFKQNCGEVVIAKARTDDKGFWITFNRRLCGQLMPTGELKDKDMPVSVKALLDTLEENPGNFAAVYGKECGECCFCGLPLTDERSTKKGYGPICAGHYNLPWGD